MKRAETSPLALFSDCEGAAIGHEKSPVVGKIGVFGIRKGGLRPGSSTLVAHFKIALTAGQYAELSIYFGILTILDLVFKQYASEPFAFNQPNGHDKYAAADNETRHAHFPHPNLPPQAREGAIESLREFR